MIPVLTSVFDRGNRDSSYHNDSSFQQTNHSLYETTSDSDISLLDHSCQMCHQFEKRQACTHYRTPEHNLIKPARKYIHTTFKYCRFCSQIFTSSVRLLFHIDARHRSYHTTTSTHSSSDSISSILSSPKIRDT